MPSFISRAGFQQQMGTMFAMGGKIGTTEIAGDATKPGKFFQLPIQGTIEKIILTLGSS